MILKKKQKKMQVAVANLLINTRILFPFLLIFFYLFTSCINKEVEIEKWQIYQMHHKGNDLLASDKQNIVYSTIPMTIDYSVNKIVLNWREKKVKFNFDFLEEDGYKYLNINHSNDKRFVGEFGMTIDTIRVSSSNIELRIILESKDTYLVGKKSIFIMP
ncbi:hypothetical protein [Aquimarina sp. 2201CG5-10]|uniref:hypothetical protein n=1 Tax=Aquimarina callyspongiae TaxID=3098150 RepID=UPI002AB3D8A0|nr:hypothetical protein [Aquimarina sp. 2201CG5-10]MDY8138489.1 hypothetical protein [Aquimarina sp. 2201CG5-10]